MSDDSEKAEELLKESGEQKLHETEAPEPEPKATDDDDDEPPELEDAVADAYQKIDDGDLSSNLTLRDDNLAALFHGLEKSERLPEVGEAAAEELERDDETDTRAAVLRMLVRIGLKEADESIIESGKAGRDQFFESDEF